MDSSFLFTPLIILTVLFSSVGQILLKIGARSICNIDCTFSNSWIIAMKLMCNPFIIVGLTIYFFSMITWLLILSRVDISYALPFMALIYIIMTIVGYIFFQENITIFRIIGISAIIIGVCFVAKS